MIAVETWIKHFINTRGKEIYYWGGEGFKDVILPFTSRIQIRKKTPENIFDKKNVVKVEIQKKNE